MNFVRTLSRSSAILALALVLPAAAKPPKQVECEITKGTNPGGQGHYTGKASFSREDIANVFKVTWKLSDGSTFSGWGVPYPDSGYLAVAYGSQATGVAIYKINGADADVRTAVAKEGAAIGSRELTRGKEKNEYVNKDGSEGIVRFTPTKVEGVANMAFKSPAGESGGIGISDGKFLAVGMASGTKDFGVALYQLGKGASAHGKWTIAGAPGTGTEELTILAVDGEKVAATAAENTPEAAPPAKEAKDEKNAELVEKISIDLKKCGVIAEQFVGKIKLNDIAGLVAQMDDRAFSEKVTREAFQASMESSSKILGQLAGFKPDRKKLDFGAAKEGGMNFVLEGDGTYENGTTHEVLRFFKPPGGEQVVLVGYSRSAKK